MGLNMFDFPGSNAHEMQINSYFIWHINCLLKVFLED